MKRRQYVIIVEEKNNQEIREVNTIEDVADVINEYTYGLFWNEDDCMPEECIETRNFKGLKEYLLFLNKNNHEYIELYCDSLSKLYRTKNIRQLYSVVDNFRKVLLGMNINIGLFLNSRKYNGNEKQFGPCGV